MNERHTGGLSRKVLMVLAAAIGIGLVAAVLEGKGAVLLSFLPYLLVLACPLMMVFMMGSMGSMGHNHMSEHDGHQDNAPGMTPELHGRSREDQVRALRGELTKVAWRQEALRQDLERLEAESKAERVIDAEHSVSNR